MTRIRDAIDAPTVLLVAGALCISTAVGLAFGGPAALGVFGVFALLAGIVGTFA